MTSDSGGDVTADGAATAGAATGRTGTAGPPAGDFTAEEAARGRALRRAQVPWALAARLAGL
ncbi:hypothetical protein, partial [Peterkaempfera griseoplana]|uniref:hypothetical protein n=1 Tax=Peterkaempfera griseoplana TaxID=66896 RepID=UPI0006E183DB